MLAIDWSVVCPASGPYRRLARWQEPADRTNAIGRTNAGHRRAASGRRGRRIDEPTGRASEPSLSRLWAPRRRCRLDSRLDDINRMELARRFDRC